MLIHDKERGVYFRTLDTLMPAAEDNVLQYSRKKYQRVEVCLLGVNEAIGRSVHISDTK